VIETVNSPRLTYSSVAALAPGGPEHDRAAEDQGGDDGQQDGTLRSAGEFLQQVVGFHESGLEGFQELVGGSACPRASRAAGARAAFAQHAGQGSLSQNRSWSQ